VVAVPRRGRLVERMSFMTLEDVKETIRVKLDVYEFIDRFELDIEDMLIAFSDKIQEEIDLLAIELEMEEAPEEYEDR
jgi:hypothetical protein